MANAKKKVKKAKNIRKDGGKLFFTTELGIEIELLPVSPYLISEVEKHISLDWIDGYTDYEGNEFEPHGTLPIHPTYTVKMGDKKVEMDHNESTLDDPKSEEQTKKNYRVWEYYQDELSKYNAFHTQRISMVILQKGIKVDYPDSDEWVVTQKLLGAKVPEEEPYRKMHYVRTEILGSVKDMFDIVAEIMGKVGMDRGEVERIKEESFPSNI